MITFGIDYDGTYSRDPMLFLDFVRLAKARGHRCVLVTGRSDEGRWGQEVRIAVGSTMPIVFADGGWKDVAAERAGYKIDVWIDNDPQGIRELPADQAAFKRKRTEAGAT